MYNYGEISSNILRSYEFSTRNIHVHLRTKRGYQKTPNIEQKNEYNEHQRSLSMDPKKEDKKLPWLQYESDSLGQVKLSYGIWSE